MRKKGEKTQLQKDLEALDSRIERRRCKRCGLVFKYRLSYKQDTWYLGDYGCRIEDCPISSWEVHPVDCPKCSKEMNDILGTYRQKVVARFEAQGYGKTEYVSPDDIEYLTAAD